jgi:hypothetical protein
MASAVNAALCALLAAGLSTVLGYALLRPLLPRVLAIGGAPVIGWAAFSAASLPVLTLTGFSSLHVWFIAALCVTVAAALLRSRPAEAIPSAAMAWWTFIPAAALAAVPAAALLPKMTPVGVHLADPVFDHAKIALIDAMTRQGLPPVNPVFGQFGGAGQLAYYYLWHFSAAEWALPLGLSGWEADIGLTWFTAFASLCLMMGISVWLSGRAAAAIVAVILAAGASLRATLSIGSGNYTLEPFLEPPNGFAGWLFQSAWVPQHLMAACCAVAAMLILVHATRRQTVLLLCVLILVVTAGFESSTYVGGVTFGLAAAAAAPFLLASVPPGRRIHFAAGLAAAAILVLILAAPFLRAEAAIVGSRGGASPIFVDPTAVLGSLFPPALRRLLDLPAYWLVLLPIEFPATFIAGTAALVVLARSGQALPQRLTAMMLAILAGTGLAISWLLVGTLGDNNDLGLRAVLPAAIILIAAAAAGVVLLPRRTLIVVAAIGGLVLSLPDTARMIESNIAGNDAPDAAIFAQAPALWAAVRRVAPANARVANNPLFLADLTRWPVNISWALFADRSSCFAGREMALAFAPLSAERRDAIDAQFKRIFAGDGTREDIDAMARDYGCSVVVLVPQDGAWDKDPFAARTDYSLSDTQPGRWRIYQSVDAAAKSRQTN